MHDQSSNDSIVAGGRLSFESDPTRQGVCKGSRMADLIRRNNAEQMVVQRRQSNVYEFVL